MKAKELVALHLITGDTVVAVKGEEFRAETASYVLLMSSEKTLHPILTTCGLSIRKSKIQLQR